MSDETTYTYSREYMTKSGLKSYPMIKKYTPSGTKSSGRPKTDLSHLNFDKINEYLLDHTKKATCSEFDISTYVLNNYIIPE